MEKPRKASWLQRNWVALWAASCFINTLFYAWKWFQFHREDSAIEAFFNLLIGIAFAFVHRNRRKDEEHREAMKRVREEHPFPSKTNITSTK